MKDEVRAMLDFLRGAINVEYLPAVRHNYSLALAALAEKAFGGDSEITKQAKAIEQAIRALRETEEKLRRVYNKLNYELRRIEERVRWEGISKGNKPERR